jgi:hypothetical protein
LKKLDRGESTLFDKIDTSQVQLKRDKPGMITAKINGAKEIEKRVACPIISNERRKMNSW